MKLLKICTGCGVEKNAEADFYKTKNRKGVRMPNARCKACTAVSDRTPIMRLSRFKSQLKRQQITCDLTLEQYTEIVSKACDYCGYPISETGKGMDRIDNSLGYTVSNVVPACGGCNEFRGIAFEYEEMKQIGPVIKHIKDERKRKGLPDVEAYCQRAGKRDRTLEPGTRWWRDKPAEYKKWDRIKKGSE